MTAFVAYYWRLPQSKLTSLPCLFKTFFCRSCLCKTALSFQDCFLHALYMILSEFHTTYLLDFWLSIFLSPEFQIKFDHVWTCLNMSEHVWTCLINIWSCLIMLDQLSANILPSLIKLSDRVWSCIIKSDPVWTCLIEFLIMSYHVWSTVGRNTSNFD
jgi:hypothetical protein